MKRTAFSLVELLVVVCIIAILAGMLLPALNSARLKALQLSCQTNIKSVYTGGIALYSADEDGWLVPYKSWYYKWTRLLGNNYFHYPLNKQSGDRSDRAMALKTVFFCPMDQRDGTEIYCGGDNGWVASTYAINMEGCTGGVANVITAKYKMNRLINLSTLNYLTEYSISDYYEYYQRTYLWLHSGSMNYLTLDGGVKSVRYGNFAKTSIYYGNTINGVKYQYAR